VLHFLIADDHALVRSGLRRILEDAFAPAVIGEAGDGEEALAELARRPWDLLLLDVSMKGRSGLDILRDVRATQPKLPVLIVSMHSEDEFAVRALRAGANGYITKDRAPEELVDAVARVLRGGRWIGEALLHRLTEELAHGHITAPHEALSPREFEVFRGLAAGRTVSELAQSLTLSVKTISTYRTRILEKMRLSNNAELAQYALRNGLVQLT
jgi:DNA-binding NarL/FixJ family response regulator